MASSTAPIGAAGPKERALARTRALIEFWGPRASSPPLSRPSR